MLRQSRIRAWYTAPAIVGVATVFASVLLAAVAPRRVVGGTHELPGFALWTVPLAFVVSRVAQRWPFERLPPLWRACAVSLIGLLLGVSWTLVGWVLIGGWMLTWDFPVFYCWTLGAAFGMLFGTWARGSIRPIHAAMGTLVALAPLSALAWQGSRPQPAVLIVYRKSSLPDAPQVILDSVLTVPHPSGNGREIRWPYSQYSRTTHDGHEAALIVLRDAADRQQIRRALAGNPLVLSVIDTVQRR
jgi:hypothetical protein